MTAYTTAKLLITRKKNNEINKHQEYNVFIVIVQVNRCHCTMDSVYNLIILNLQLRHKRLILD